MINLYRRKINIVDLVIIYSAYTVILFFACCNQEDEGRPQGQEYSLGFSVEKISADNSNGRVASDIVVADMRKAIITILNSDGSATDFTNAAVDLYVLDDRVFTEKITLPAGSYQLTAFGLADESNEILFAIPLEISPLSENVSTPLVIDFQVNAESKEVINLEVISVNQQDPTAFGFDFFEVGIVETIDFLISISTLGDTSFIAADLKIMYGSNYNYTQKLSDAINKVQVKDQSSESYIIEVKAVGYETFTTSLTRDELLLYETEDRVLAVELVRSEVETFLKRYGGSGSELIRSVVQVSDGGYVLVGPSSSSDGDVGENQGGNDMLIMKLDNNGDLMWVQTFGSSYYDDATAVIEVSDGGYVVAGSAGALDGDVDDHAGGLDVWVIKLNTEGHLEWNKTYGGTSDDFAQSIQETNEGKFIVAGYTKSTDGDIAHNHGSEDAWLLEINELGELEWEKTFGGTSNERARSVLVTKDGGYVLGGYTASLDGDVSNNNGGYDFWILKVASDGALLWEETYGGTGNDYAYATCLTVDGGYAMAGTTYSSNGDVVEYKGGLNDAWIIKLNENGEMDWSQAYGGTSGDVFHAVTQAADDGFVMAGYSNSSDGDVGENNGALDGWVLKSNSNGDLVWSQVIGGSSDDTLFAIDACSEGGVIVGGSVRSSGGILGDKIGHIDILLIKMDDQGNF